MSGLAVKAEPVEHSFSVFFVVGKSTYIEIAVAVYLYALAVLLVIVKLALVYLSFTLAVHSAALFAFIVHLPEIYFAIIFYQF